MTKPILSIIIPTHNSASTIENCIRSLISQSYPRENFEIIVIDDGSTDRTVEMAKSTGANYVITIDPCSVSRARNRGVENSKADLLAFIDSDCEAKNGWIETIIGELQKVHATSGPIENGNPQSLVAWSEYFIEFGGFHEFKERSYVRFFPGCNGACTKEAFLKVGGFKDLRISEDVLFGESLRQAGMNVLFVPNAKILHLCRTDLKKVRSNLKLLGKYTVRSRKISSSIPYGSLMSRWLVPIIFFGKFVLSAKYAIESKKTSKFLYALPIVILDITSFCRGIWDELGVEKK